MAKKQNSKSVEASEKKSAFKIESGIEIPARVSRAPKYPFAQMANGDSIFAPGISKNALYGSARHHSKRNGGKFVVRAVTEDGVAGARVWRSE